MAPGWPCSSAQSSSSSSSHTSTTFSCWWLGAWSKPFDLSHSSFFLILCLHLLEPLYAPLWLVWLISMPCLNRDSIPDWLINPHIKSQVGQAGWRVVNPEESPWTPTLILSWVWLLVGCSHVFAMSLWLCPGFPPGLVYLEYPLCTAELDTHTSSYWQKSIYVFAMCPSRGRKTCPWSQPARHEVSLRWFTTLFAWAVWGGKKESVAGVYSGTTCRGESPGL